MLNFQFGTYQHGILRRIWEASHIKFICYNRHSVFHFISFERINSLTLDLLFLKRASMKSKEFCFINLWNFVYNILFRFPETEVKINFLSRVHSFSEICNILNFWVFTQGFGKRQGVYPQRKSTNRWVIYPSLFTIICM